MKKITLLFLLFTSTASATIAGVKVKKSKKTQTVAPKTIMSRQCCTKSGVMESGGVLTITACSGSFLTNGTTSYERACNKAQTALLSALN